MDTQTEQLLELMLHLKQATPAAAKQILNSQPQIAYKLISLMVSMNAIDIDVFQYSPHPGIARSTPRANFFASRAERALFSVRDGLSHNASAEALARTWARGTLIGGLAGERDDGSLTFIHTDHTARDMLEIVKAHGRDKLQYWGFSYGSVLGATFAAMFPNNVERLIIDGVVDSENYYATEWSNNLRDTDAAYRSFAVGCAAAGPSGCPFHAHNANEILSNIDALAESLRSRPIPVKTATSYGLVDYSVLRSTIFKALYSPHAAFPRLAKALADLRDGNATGIWAMSVSGALKPFDCACGAADPFESVDEATWAVLCNDGDRIPPGYDEFEAHYKALSRTSSFADQWELPRMGCLAWPKFKKTNFQGPFVANTSFPLLFIGNTADPVTPLWSYVPELISPTPPTLFSAHKMSKGFAGSVVLTQDSAGHCSLSAPSTCTAKIIRAYFLEGKLPEPGTVCDIDRPVFPVAAGYKPNTDGERLQAAFRVTTSSREVKEEDRKLAGVLEELAMTFRVPGLGL
ncbi:Abhydrolase-4 domain-containing protein [Mycena kentingensis (nom. inval.)]|nr:Abhydrolase-4 domain-containing protein [Mycena kentingensis (nom. inval.)]